MNYSIIDIKNQLNNMLYLNTLSYSMLSGCGNCSEPNSEDFHELDVLLQCLPVDARPYNIFFTDSLYKKCMPQYEMESLNPYDFSSFKWVSKKRKEEIDIDVMANSILACCKLIEKILTFELQPENRNFILYMLQKTALNQIGFIKQHLKVGEMYYNGEDIADEGSKERHIQIASDNPDRVSQYAVFHALSALLQLNSYQLDFLQYNEESLVEDLSALPAILESFTEKLIESSSKELSLIGLHLTEIYKENECLGDCSRKALNLIARELCRRIDENGQLKRSANSEDFASPNTTANCINLLSQYAYMFASKSSYEASRRLFAQFASYWDHNSSTFLLSSSNKQSYNIKVISSILAALFSYARIVHHINEKEILQNIIVSFVNTVFVKSGIFNGQCTPILQHEKIQSLDVIACHKPWAPVFNKAFEYKVSKRKYYCDADVFRADYVLPACVILLNSISN